MAKIYFEIGGDINLKQAFVSSLPKLLASRTMTIIEEKFQSITIPQVGYIRQAIFIALEDISREEINALVVFPQVELKVNSSKWDKPTRVIAFIDTGAACSLMNPIVLPEDQWVSHYMDFNIASNGIMTTTVITNHPVTIELFPRLKYRTKLIGSDVPGKDLIVGFVIFRQLKDQLQIRANEITFKKQFKPYSEIPRLFQISNDEQIKEIEQNLIEHSCAESHKDFMKKGKCPLWKNEEFFYQDPFQEE
ncbi:uncharacterized protein [Nicotiana tomentosiformis]|uniref:uncharacterized protein n=1 Tax=Nicotiana tomentosiformis TaxID=4098 RepID=UPI00388C8169